VCKAGCEPGVLKLTVTAPGLKPAVVSIPVVQAEVREGISPLAYLAGEDLTKEKPVPIEEIPVRNIRMVSSNGLHLYAENLETEVQAYLCPENATDREVFWSVVDDGGIPLKIAEIEPDGRKVKVRAKSDGSFRLRCMSKCGTDKIRIISQLEFMISGLGTAFTNPYEFVSAGLYNYSKGDIGNGNEHGVATARDGESQVGFRDIDFGPYGSDEIILPIFALTDDPYEIQIYEGIPEEGGELIADVIYQKPKMWNVYQEAVYKLNKRLKGVTGICFVVKEKLHIKGFRFKKYNRAWQQVPVTECDRIYGDSFERQEEAICKIGNNVTIEFENLEFGDQGAGKLILCGSTPLEKNTIIVRFISDGKEERQMLEFAGGQETQEFVLKPVYGTKTVSFVFLPGSSFDFRWFCFKKQGEK